VRIVWAISTSFLFRLREAIQDELRREPSIDDLEIGSNPRPTD
jgi:hypothetical protein